jgi:carboxypeptidase Q
MRRASFAAVLLASLLVPAAPHGHTAADAIDPGIVAQIRAEATERSQIMQTLHRLTDVYGPRLTGSPNLKAASEWVVAQTTGWGLQNARLEPWDFGRPGWVNERTAAFLVAPVRDSLVVETLAWTPGTNGPVTAPVVVLEPPARPTREQLDAFFARHIDLVKGRIVLVGRHVAVPVTITPPPRRRQEAEVRRALDPAGPGPQALQPPPAAAQQPPANAAQQQPAAPGAVPAAQVLREIDEFLVRAGAVARVNDAGRDHGQIRAFNNRTFDVTKAVPTLVMRNEDYGRISRLAASGFDVRLDIDIVNRVYPEGATQYNVIAEIPGTDKAHEVVMLGGHIDGWHAATAATDNAIGCAVTMEAVRILQAIGVRPRRTIRLALWSGEEQGLLGSQAYVKEHFGTFENPKPAYEHFAGYVNIDTGTGRARAMSVFGPQEAASVLQEALAPFAGDGVLGASATRSRRRGGSDHSSFNEAGLPGISVLQDPIEYQTATWHTNLDTYERIIEADARISAMAIAAAVYHLATREEKLPRFTTEQMPALPGAAPTTTTP